MKKFSALFLMILALTSCRKDNSAKIELTSDYFPLKVGNYWDFDYSGKYLVKESQLLNEVEYFEIVNDNGSSAFYRIHDNKVYVRENAIGNKEELKFDLAANKNDPWNYGVGKVALVNRNATISIGDLQIESCLQFDFYNNNLIDYSSSIWLAPGVGFIQQTCQECFGSSFKIMKLVKVNISNKVTEFK